MTKETYVLATFSCVVAALRERNEMLRSDASIQLDQGYSGASQVTYEEARHFENVADWLSSDYGRQDVLRRL